MLPAVCFKMEQKERSVWVGAREDVPKYYVHVQTRFISIVDFGDPVFCESDLHFPTVQ